MIRYKGLSSYCSEDIKFIENYDIAVNSKEIWHCHHRGEILPCGRYSKKDLIKFGLYYHRPAKELIFLKEFDHLSLHKKGVRLTDQHRKSIGDTRHGKEHHNSKCVLQFSLNGKFIRKFDYIFDVQNVLGINHAHVSEVCKGKRKTAGGFIWKYED